MRILALDLGTKRTGVAFADSDIGIPLPLDTILSNSPQGLLDDILLLADERDIDMILLGLPLLPTGKEGSQTEYVRDMGSLLEEKGIPTQYLDERYTSQKHGETDGDAKAACTLLSIYLERTVDKG